MEEIAWVQDSFFHLGMFAVNSSGRWFASNDIHQDALFFRAWWCSLPSLNAEKPAEAGPEAILTDQAP
ncbi:hypothetical protein [Rhodoferax ferrireducens]|uniref:hypothetical protein n=1 Tax=Rhodoferax ferrireducens TaxID=192843 RepID=UPI00130038F9|nr:hypothetical protein [Rhodoferax ferrireducens]